MKTYQYTVNREALHSLYLDWVNNYLTIEKFADHNGLHTHEAQQLVDLAQVVFESNHPDA